MNPISTNERTIIHTIVKWSRSAVILAVVSVLLVAYVFVNRVQAQSMAIISQSQQETSKIKAQLTETESQIKVREETIQQLQKENSELKE